MLGLTLFFFLLVGVCFSFFARGLVPAMLHCGASSSHFHWIVWAILFLSSRSPFFVMLGRSPAPLAADELMSPRRTSDLLLRKRFSERAPKSAPRQDKVPKRAGLFFSVQRSDFLIRTLLNPRETSPGKCFPAILFPGVSVSYHACIQGTITPVFSLMLGLRCRPSFLLDLSVRSLYYTPANFPADACQLFLRSAIRDLGYATGLPLIC